MAPVPPFNERVLASALEKQAAARPQSRALEFPTFGVSWSYRELLYDTMAIAGGLQALGVKNGDRLAIMLGNRPEYVLAWWASLFTGSIDVSINHELTGDLLAHQLRVSSVSAIVCDNECLPAIQSLADQLPDLEVVIVVDGAKPERRASSIRLVDFDELARSRAGACAPRKPAEIVSIRYTSGTTGPAKAVASTNSQLIVGGSHFNWLTDFKVDDRLYTSFPLHHGLASVIGVSPAILAGACCIVDDRFSASQFWERIRRYEATLAHIINPIVPMLMAQPPAASDRDHNCSRLWTANRNAAFENRFATRNIMIYSASEGNVMAYTAPGDEEKPESCGKTSPLFHLQIVDENDFPVPPGVEGELQWRPREPHLTFAGYFGDPEATARSSRNFWYCTGDVCRLDEDGYLYLIGRIGDQIRCKGVNVPASSIEDVAKRFSGVVEAAAIAVPSELGESEIKLCLLYEGDKPATEDLVAFLSEHLPKSMRPRYLEFKTSFPRTDTHKIAKRILRDEGESGLTPGTIDLDRRRSQ